MDGSYRHRMAEKLREPLNDCEPEPEALCAVALWICDLEELLENLRELHGLDANPAVADRDADVRPRAAAAEDQTACLRVPDGVRHQVAHYALEQGCVARHNRARRNDDQAQALLLSVGSAILGYALENRLEREIPDLRP